MQDNSHINASTSTTWLRPFAHLGEVIEAWPKTTRWLLCGPFALIVTLLIMMGMAHWWPQGTAQIDNIAMPVVLFPLIWAAVFFYSLAEDRLARGTLVLMSLALGNTILIFVSL